MPEIAQEAMEALLVLHQPEHIDLWNPEAPINTFWDVRYVYFKVDFSAEEAGVVVMLAVILVLLPR
jgi:neurofibromin 1